MRRAVLKTASYSLMHLSVAVMVAFALTRDLRIALSIGLIEPTVQTVAYAIHEKIWRRLDEREGGGPSLPAAA